MSNPSVRDVLVAARKLIEKPEQWVGGGEQYDFSRKCAGIALDSGNGNVGGTYADWSAACNLFRKVIGADDIIPWNDTPGRTHAEVLSMFDKAIAECGQ